MFKNLKLGARISLGFGALILIVAGIAALAWVNLERIDAESRVITVDCLPGAALAGAIESGAWQYFSNVTRHVVAEDASDMAECRKEAEESMAAVKEALTKYEQTITLDEDRQLFARLTDVLLPFEAHAANVMSLGDEGKKDESRAELTAAEDEVAQVKVAARAISEFNARNGARAGSAITGILSTARFALGLGSAAGVLLGILLAWFITRGITKPVNRIIQALTNGSNQVNDASRQVSSASQQLAAGASEQASSLEETSSALEEMAAMTRTNAANSEKANGLAAQARQNATTGEKTMGELNNAMSAINDSAAQIGKIIKVIEEIAFQTNLLALNAAVEAARAGEHGKGFAVVAEEVRNLAQRSAQAARDTTNLIEGAVTRAKEGTTVASEAAKSLNAIVGDVANVAELLSGISRASNEQAQGVDQINSAVSQMDKVTQQNAAGAEESASAAEELSAQAQTVKAVVDELTALVRGGRAASGAHGQVAQPRPPKKATKPEPSPRSASKPAVKFGPKPAASKATSDDEQFAALAETAQSFDSKYDGASGDLSGF